MTDAVAAAKTLGREAPVQLEFRHGAAEESMLVRILFDPRIRDRATHYYHRAPEAVPERRSGACRPVGGGYWMGLLGGNLQREQDVALRGCASETCYKTNR